MPKLSTIPRLSIVAPVTGDTARFETSLVSILENRPNACEIIVPHDGSYDDPFDLGDEVRFIDAGSDRLVDMIHEAARQAHGRFVHCLCDGVCATEGWADAALAKFEHSDAGIVVPVLRDFEGFIVAAGWQDSSRQLCFPADQDRQELGRKTAARIGGGYLQCSFWRRDLLRSMKHGFDGGDTIEAAYAYAKLAKSAQWRVVLATESTVRQESDSVLWDDPTVSRGRRLRAIKHVDAGIGWGQAFAESAKSVLANLLSPAGIPEALGQLFAPSEAADLRRAWRPEEVWRNDASRNVLTLTPTPDRRTGRRAA